MDTIRLAIREELAPLLAELRAFVDRRVAELSADLHASVQLGEMGEERVAARLAAIGEGIAQLIALPASATRNSGLELEAVVQATEAAATTILEAAEAIQDWAAGAARHPADLRALAERVNAIFEACSFQDLTGQHLRRAIQHLQQVEAMLAGILPGPAAPTASVEVRTAARTVADTTPDLGQAEIDALLTG